jgi:nucleotide-binding universal stress UspA family protein
MYKRIMVALENAVSDTTVIPHISQLAHIVGAELLLFHVADGWAARNFNQLSLNESEEIKTDRAYLEKIAEGLRATGLVVKTSLAMGNPPQEILRAAQNQSCDLIAMTSHGHKLIADLFLGSTIDRVRHNTTIPILVVRAENTQKS